MNKRETLRLIRSMLDADLRDSAAIAEKWAAGKRCDERREELTAAQDALAEALTTPVVCRGIQYERQWDDGKWQLRCRGVVVLDQPKPKSRKRKDGE